MTPTLTIEIWRKIGSDLRGQPVFTQFPNEKVAPVKLIFGETHTTVRTDSSGSHGNASESMATVKVLAKSTSAIQISDKLVIRGNGVRVVTVQPRYTVAGALDHLEVDGVAWG